MFETARWRALLPHCCDRRRARAAAVPDQAVTMLVPYAAGGPTDTVARVMAQAMGKPLGQTVIVENRPSAGGILAPETVKNAKPDGYTILIHHIGMATTPALYRQLRFNPLTDFEYIGLINDVPMTHHRAAELAGQGLQGVPRLHQGEQGQGDLRQRRHRRRLAPVRHAVHERDPDRPARPCRTRAPAPAMNDLLGGQVDFMCDQTTNTTAQIKGGKVKVYGVTSRKRVASLPDVPTLRRAGPEGLRGRHLARPVRAQGHAQAGDRQAGRRAAGALKDADVKQALRRPGRRRLSGRTRRRPRRCRRTSRPRSTSGGRSSRRPASTPTEFQHEIKRRPRAPFLFQRGFTPRRSS